MDFDLRLNKAEKAVALAIVLCLVAGFLLLVSLGKLELLPTTMFGLFTMGLAFLAYHFTRAKFRLDLFEKRWALYESLVNFCSIATATGVDSTKALEAAQGCFRGIGYHKGRALFGPDIRELFDKMNVSYSWLASHQNSPMGVAERNDWADKSFEHSMFVWNTVTSMPDLFQDYLYFGDYKK